MHKIGFLIYNGANEIEICGAYDVFTSIRTTEAGRWTNEPAYSACLVAETLNPITTAHGIVIQPTVKLSDCGKLDVIVVPGGPGARTKKHTEPLLDWLRINATDAQYIVSFTTAAFILARAGLLKGRRLTTYPGFVSDIQQLEPTCTVTGDDRISLHDGCLFSTSGIAGSIEASLALVERMEGVLSAELAARRISWPCPIDEFIPVYST